MFLTAPVCSLQLQYVPYSSSMFLTAPVCSLQLQYVPTSLDDHQAVPPKCAHHNTKNQVFLYQQYTIGLNDSFFLDFLINPKRIEYIGVEFKQSHGMNLVSPYSLSA